MITYHINVFFMISDLIDNGIIILNKPPKIISHEITTWVKKIIGAKRAGHAGTLDPNVSGVLPIALGKATKLLTYIAPKDKTYVGIIKFRKVLSRDEIEDLFKKFTGEITQLPPKVSAVKKVKRKRRIYYIKFLEQGKENPRLVLFETQVDAGTYIRTLCEDIGTLCGGARMEELRRIAVGKIKENQAITIYDLIDALWFWKNKNNNKFLAKIIHSPEKFIDFARVIVKNSAVSNIKNGAQIMFPAIKEVDQTVKKDKLVAIYSEANDFLGIGECKFDYNEFQDIKNNKDKTSLHGLAVKIKRMHL